MDLLLIRHGQSGNNLLWEQTGSSRGRSPDPGLTRLGHRQAAALARALAAGVYGPRPTHVYTSLMLRAVQTAAPLAEALDLPLLGRPDTFEVFGPVVHDGGGPEGGDLRGAQPFPGAGRDALTAVSPRLVWPSEAVPDESGWWAGPVERMDQVPARAAAVATALTEAHPGPDDVVALVSHGTFGQFLLRELLGIGSMSGWIDLANTSVTRFGRVTPASATTLVSVINRVDHLIVGAVAGSS